MSSDEFYDAIERYEKVLLPCYTLFCCLWPCFTNPIRFKKVTDELNYEYKKRQIRFKVESRTELVTNLQQDMKGEPNVRTDDIYFLFITQN
jgi:hypothetical protein